jgi:hypothetical protein
LFQAKFSFNGNPRNSSTAGIATLQIFQHQERTFAMRNHSTPTSMLSKTGLIAIVMLVLPLALTAPARAEARQPVLVAQQNPFNNVEDGVLPLTTAMPQLDTMRTETMRMDTQRRMDNAMPLGNPNDAQGRRIAREAEDTAMRRINPRRMMQLHRTPFQTISPR